MQIARIARHLLAGRRRLRHAFAPATLDAIEAAIQASEATHVGEIRFAVEAGLDGVPLFRGLTARERAIEVFSQLRVWDTELNNGVLVYLLLADHAVEIVADRGVDAKVGAPEWSRICREMEAAFRQGDFEGGVLRGLQAVTRHLAQHFPAAAGDRNELPNRPAVM